MTLTQFQYLIALSQYRSMSKAAKSLYITQPAMSVKIREMEDELGYPLLIRTRQGIEFTERGKLVLAKAKTIMDEVQSIHHIGNQGDDTLCGTVNVGSTPHICASLLMDVIMELNREHPNLSVYCHGSDSDSIISRVETGELDLGIIQLCDIDEAEFARKVDEGLLSTGDLFSERIRIVAREGHPLHKQEEVSLYDLTNYPFATFGRATNRKLFSIYRQFNRQNRIVRIGEISALRKYEVEYDPITAIPESAVNSGNNYMAYGRLRPVNVPEFDQISSVVWVHNTDAMTPQMLKTIEVISRICGKNYQ